MHKFALSSKAPLLAGGALLLACLAMLASLPSRKSRPASLEEIVFLPAVSQREFARQYGFGLVQGQMLWGGKGKVTTGTSVDGRPTVPGLHTDCIPGVLRSDCSPAQEDGAWSTEAASWLDQHTGNAHSSTMTKIQDDVDRAYAERDKFLADCLQDASLCSGRRTDASFGARMKGSYGDTPKWGGRTHPWAPEQGADFGEYDNDGWLSPHHSGTNPVCYSTEKAVISGVHSLWCYGMAGTDARYAATRHWSHVALPSGTTGDGALVSDSYYAGSV